MRSKGYCLRASSIVSVFVLFFGLSAFAANGIWNGTQNALWTNSANWSASPYPSGDQVATFTNSGAGRTTIDLTGLPRFMGVTNLIFDTASAAAYTLGSGALNEQSLAFTNRSYLRLTSNVRSNQTVNALILLGHDRSSSLHSFRNDRLGNTLTLAGDVTTTNSGGTAGAKYLSLEGSGAITVSGNMTVGGASSLTVTNATTGPLILSGTNRISTLVAAGGDVTITGTNRIDAIRVNTGRPLNVNTTNTISALYLSGDAVLPAIVNIASGGCLSITNSGGDGFYATGDATINGPGALEMQGGVTNDMTSNNYVAPGKTLTINAPITGASAALELWSGTGTYIFNGINTFLGPVTIGPACTVSIAKMGNKGSTTSNLGSGTTVTLGATGTRLLYTGVGETSDRTFAVNNSAIIEQGGSGHLNLSAQVNVSSGSKTLTLQGSTLATAEFSGLLRNDLGTLSLAKAGTGTWLLTTNHTFTGTTTVNNGVLALTGINGTLSSSTGYILAGGTLLLDNTAEANNTNRLRDASAITLNGGKLRFSNTGGSANYSENAGVVTANAGYSTIETLQAAAGQTATLRLAALTNNAGGAVNFIGTGLGQSDRNRIYITNQPNGLIGPWATVDGARLAAYSSVNGVYAAGDAAFTDIAARGPSTIVDNSGSNVRISSAGTSGPIALGSATTRVASLLQDTTTDAEINTAGKTFQTGGIVIPVNRASVTVGQAPNDGILSSVQSSGEVVLNNNSANDLVVNAVVANNGTATRLGKVGTGTAKLSADNTFSGITAIGGGTLILAHSNALQNSTLSTAGAVFDQSVANHAFNLGGLSGSFPQALADNAGSPNPVALTVGKNNASTTYSGALSGSGSLTKTGTGTLTLSTANPFNGGLTIEKGTVTASTGGALGAGAVVNKGTLNLTGASDITYTGLSVGLSGAGTNNVTLGTGTARVYLNGDYSGFTGVWNIGIGAAAGAARAEMNGLDHGDATINVRSNATLWCYSAVTHNAKVFLNGGDTGESYGQLRIDNNANWAGPVTLLGPVTNTADGFLGSEGGVGMISGDIGEVGGPYEVAKAGTQTLILTGDNTFRGPVWVKAGTLRVPAINSVNAGAGPLGAPTNAAQGTLKIGYSTTGSTLSYVGMGDTSDRAIDLAGTTGGATIDHSGTNTLTLTGGMIVSGTGTKTLTLQGGTNGMGVFTGVISNGVGSTIALTKAGAGTWKLTNANTYSGGTQVKDGGTLVAAHPNALGTGMILFPNLPGTIDFANDGVGETPYDITMNANAVGTLMSNRGTEGEGINHSIGALHLSAVTLNVTNGANVVSGTPSITASWLNIYSGSTSTLILFPTTADLIIGWAAVISNNFAKTLQLDGTSTGSAFTGPISNGLNTVSVTKKNVGTWTFYGSNTYSGATSIDGGRLVVAGANGAMLGAGGITLNPDGTLLVTNSVLANNANRLSDTGSITMKGGTLVYAHNGGATNYSENAGALVVNVKSNILVTSQADVGSTSLVTFASLSRTGDGMIDFRGEGLGVDERNEVRFATPPAEGLIGLWATCNSTNYAAYSNAYGVVAAGEGLFSDIPARGPYTIADDATLNARINSEGVEGPLSLAGATTSNLKSLMQDSEWASTVAMTNQTLLTSDIMIAAGKQSLTLGTAENEGLVMPTAAGGALTLINRSGSGTLTLNAAVTNNTSASSLAKYGSGPVLLAGRNSYTGPTLIDEGVLEFGGGLAQRLSGVISGAGTLSKSGTNQLQLLGANTFTGPVSINAGIVRPDQNNTFGTAAGGVFIADGATLDLGCDSTVGGTRGTDSLNMGAELFTVSGAGVGGAGAIVCNGGVNQANAINRISLSGNTTLGGGRRWDLRSNTPRLDLNDYTCTKTGVNEIAIISTVITPGTGHFVVNQGLLRFEGSTTVNGTSNNTVTVNSGGILELYQLYPSVPAWKLILNEGSFFRGSCGANNSATNINGWAGPVTLNGRAFFNGNASPCNWTVTGDISGPGTLVNAGNSGATLWLMGSNNTYNGETIISNGTLFAKYPGTIPGYDAGKVTVAGSGTLSIPSGDGVTGWSASQIEDLHDSSTFTATTSGLSIDTALTGIDYLGDLSKTLALTKNGDNTLTLKGANTFAGALKINKGDVVMNGAGNHKIGALTIANGTLVLTNIAPTYVYVTNSTAIVGNNTTEFGRMTVGGNSAWSSYLPPSGTGGSVLYVGNNGRGILTLQDNATVSNRLYVGNAASSAGAVYQRGGTMAHWCGASSDGRIGMTGYGYYELGGGILTNNGYCQVGRDPSGIGILVMNGGKLVQNNGYGGDLTVSRGGTGVVDLVSGSYVSIPGMTLGGASDNGGARGFAELTIENDADATLGGTLLMADRTNMFATVNLLGGRLTANLFNKATRYGSLAFLNFNGGTFRARAAGNLFGTGVNALDGVTVYPGGATIDATNLNVTANANLRAPTGNGVASITIVPRGGYIGPPFVTITGGGGVGATAIARFDSDSGFVTGITITSPGCDYTSVPTVQLSGGGTNLQTVVTGVTLAPNTSGGLTKLGNGTLTLTGTNTYGGATTLSAGTLKPTHALAIPPATTFTFAGGTLDLNGLTLTNEVNTTGALTGGITNGTLQTVFSPGGENWIDTQTYALNVRSSGVLRGSYFMDAAANGSCDVLAVQGNINLSNIDLQIVDTALLSRSKVYTILTCTGTRTGTFSSNNLPDNRWHLLYGADGSVKLAFMDGTVFMLR